MIKVEQQERLEEVIGSKYQLLCRIGGGGMAQVYLVRHRLHGGLFAVKVLAEYLAQDQSIVSRFEQEARMAASLASHPNIVPIFDIGEGSGLHYLVMQFVAGEDLASLLRRVGRIAPAAAANVIAQATEALSCAEAKRIVHRDLKLANMLLDEGGRVKLLDFGISKITDIADGLTRPGESLGTPFYMSPEQIRGEGCDIRSDLYSLGVVFFELLAGRRPFENESATAIQIAHLSTPPPSLLSLDPSLPPACETIVQKLLQKKRENRYQSTYELLHDLVAHGANAGPGTLRPVVDPVLVEAMARPLEGAPVRGSAPGAAQNGPVPELDRGVVGAASPAGSAATRTVLSTRPHQPAVMAAVATPVPGSAVGPSVGNSPAALASPGIPLIDNAEQTPVVQPGKPGLKPAILAACSLVVLLLVAASGVILLRHRSAAAAAQPSPAASQAALPAILDDANGRMLLVPAGPFEMGRPAGSSPQTPGDPARQVTLPAFYIDETEVSNAQYRRFCEATGHPTPQNAGSTAPDDPVTGVSWNDAEAYAKWAGKRLPTQEEWEKAARGTDARPFPWGAQPWTNGVPAHLEPVTSEPSRRSPYGAYNMAGNAWEWTATRDAAGQLEFDQMRRLLGSDKFSREWYVVKGGSFAPGGSSQFASYLRRGLPSDTKSPWFGFRCARDLKGA
jgi:serine/threonine-protein kinase